MRQSWPPAPEQKIPPGLWQRINYSHQLTIWLGMLSIPSLVFAGFIVSAGITRLSLVFALVIPFLFIRSLASCLLEWRLARNGTTAVGAVVQILEGRAETPATTVWTVKYRFLDESGHSHEGIIKSRNARQWMFYDGDPIEIRYDPQNPQRNTLAFI